MLKRWCWLALLAIAPLSFTASSAAQPARANYRFVSPEEFTDRFGFVATEPRELARDLFAAYTTEREGRRSESLSITYPTWETAVVIVEAVGLADDSVAASRYRVELERLEDHWQLVWVGTQTRCQPGRGHQDWSDQTCR